MELIISLLKFGVDRNEDDDDLKIGITFVRITR